MSRSCSVMVGTPDGTGPSDKVHILRRPSFFRRKEGLIPLDGRPGGKTKWQDNNCR